MGFFKSKTVLSVLLFSVFASSCAVKTDPTTLGERSARAAIDKATLFKGQENIIKPITLYEAIARAVKYNSDQRVVLMEQAIAYNIADASTMDLLPKLAANGGFVARSSQLAVSADSVNTGMQTLEDSYISDKYVGGANLEVVYNVLDFGISYVTAKQSSDKRYINEEIRRKSIQQIVHDVRTVFWKAAAAQRIEPDMNTLIASVQDALVRVRTADLSKKSMEQLAEEKKLLTALQTLMDLRNDILTAKAELSRLMNLPPNMEFELDIPSDMDNPQIVKDFGQIDLEMFALVNRPELRINDYEARIAKLQAKKELLRIFPGIEFSAGINYDSNSYLVDRNWASAGVGVTWNLMRLFTQPKAIEIANSKEELERLRRTAMTMAIMSQVNVSYLQFRQNAETFAVMNSLDKVNDRLWLKTFIEQTKTEKQRQDALVLAVDRLVSQMERDFAYADFKGAESSLYIALGVDPLPRFSPQATIHAIAENLEDNLSRNAPRGFKEVSYDKPPSDRAKLSALSEDQRVKLLEWTSFSRHDNKPVSLMNKAVNTPVLLTPAAKKVAPVKTKKAVKKAKVYSNKPMLLQLSSFESLGRAQIYWQELLAVDSGLAKYTPVYREVSVPKFGNRFRTLISDTELNLRQVCKRLAVELKSCLIYSD